MEHTVIFQPSGRRGSVAEGKTLLEAARELGVDIEAPCGGARVCGKCKIKVEEGVFQKAAIDSRVTHLSPLMEEEKAFLKAQELADNYRLCCCAGVRGDVLVFVPEESRGAKQVILETGRERIFELNPAARNYYLEMDPATLDDQTDDYARLQAGLAAKYGLPADLRIDYTVLQSLPVAVRSEQWKVTVTVWEGKEIIKVTPGHWEELWGIAIDVGTTTVVAYLCNLKTGEVPHTTSLMNPQIRYGEDVLSRITYGMMNEDGLEKLSMAIIDGVNTLVERLTEMAGITRVDVVDMVLVFNTVMHHILLRIDPKFMGRAPFAPVFKASMNFKARDLGIQIGKGAFVHTLPVAAGFVGPDNMGVLIAEEPHKQDRMRLIIDIGTNGEINFGNRERLLCTSCATGPALEGAQIKFGMRAAPGAIERVKIAPGDKEPKIKIIGQDDWYETGDEPIAKGICGSGIIDVIAEMFKAGIISSSGRFNKEASASRVRRGADGKMEYVLCYAGDSSIGQDITVTQKDVHAVLLAKAALYVGARYLMQKLGVSKPASVTLAGAFGSYINKESAMVMGMFPDCDFDHVQAVGNAAGDGAKLALLSLAKRQEAREVAGFVEFVETATESDFLEQFIAAMAFPHSKDRFPSIQHILENIP